MSLVLSSFVGFGCVLLFVRIGLVYFGLDEFGLVMFGLVKFGWVYSSLVGFI